MTKEYITKKDLLEILSRYRDDILIKIETCGTTDYIESVYESHGAILDDKEPNGIRMVDCLLIKGERRYIESDEDD